MPVFAAQGSALLRSGTLMRFYNGVRANCRTVRVLNRVPSVDGAAIHVRGDYGADDEIDAERRKALHRFGLSIVSAFAVKVFEESTLATR